MQVTYHVNEDPIEVLVFFDGNPVLVQPHHPDAENASEWASVEEAEEWATEYTAMRQADFDAGPVIPEWEPEVRPIPDEVVEETKE